MSRWRWVVLAFCVLSVPALQGLLDQRLGVFRAQSEILYVWSGEHLRRAFPGFDSILADIYWLRAVQYYGHQRAFAKEPRYDLLEPLVRITVTLDPEFEFAYRYGATFLAEPYPKGPGDGRAAVELLRRGTERMPNGWFLWQYLGLFQYLYLGDGPGAAQTLREAAHRPGAPVWLEPLAALVLRKTGDRAGARALWQSIHDHALEKEIRENARQHIARLDALDRVDVLNSLVARFRAAAGRNPNGWGELRAVGLLRRQPVDSSGVPFSYDANAGRFAVSRQSLLYLAP